MKLTRPQVWIRVSSISLAAMVCALSGCMPLPMVQAVPNLAVPSYQVAPERIATSYETLETYDEPNTPDEYDQTSYVRYFLETPSQTTRPETLMVLMPGIFSGALSLDPLARQLVAAKPNTEVWVIDRRANALEDTQIMQRALAQNNPQLAYDYYVTNALTPEGFTPLTPQEVSFMAFWGLETHLRDLHEVVKHAQTKGEQIILGGHSLGASIVSFYTAFDFGADGKPDSEPDPGYRYINGLLLIDGGLGRTGGFAWAEEDLQIGRTQLIGTVAELESGDSNAYFQDAFDPLTAAKGETSALLAALEPEQRSPGGFVPYPASNLAAFGILNDDTYAVSPVFSASIGEAVGAELGGNLLAVMLDGREGLGSQSVTGVARGYRVIEWSAGDPPQNDARSYAASRTSAFTNSSEWYFPLRLGLDMIRLDITLADAPGYVPTSDVPVPTLAIGASRGLMPSYDYYSGYGTARGVGALFSAYILEGFTHSDVVMAQNNPVVALSLQWLERLEQLGAAYAR